MTRRISHRVDLILTVFLATLLFASSGDAFAQRRPVPKAGSAHPAQPTPSGSANQVRYKGIFEPVNYPDDLNLKSVFFSSENEGWAAGEHGTIIYTADAGKSWQPQLGGDPASSDGDIYSLRFLDRKHGWAMQIASNQPALLHTRDGQHWTRTGSFPDGGQKDYAFTSETNGVYIPGYRGVDQTIRHSSDGGKTWKQVVQCAAKFPVQGLMTNVGCELRSMAFPTPNIGYAVGVGADALFVLKTSDGGATWAISVVPDMAPGFQPRVESFFMDANHGFVAVGAKLITTSDGGQNWTAVASASIPSSILFADPEVGWSMSDTLNYTTDGGRNWASRRIQLPAGVTGVSLPKRDVAYVVGYHGMVYRYHVVPVDYKAPNAVDAPAMPGSNAVLNAQLQKIRSDVAALQTKLGSNGDSSTIANQDATGASSGTAISAQPADGAMSPSSDTSGTSSAPDSGFGTTSSSMDPSAAAGGAFTQDATFTQDTSGPPSPAIQSCCAANIGTLQGEVNSFMQQVPAASSQFRNLNLVIAGTRMVSDLFTKSKGFKDAFVALKKSPNLQTASAALQDLMSKLDGVGQTLGSGFQNPPPLPDLGGISGASAVAGQAFSATSTDGTATGASNNGSPADASANNDPKKPTAQDKTKEVQDKIKKKLKIPF